MGANTDDSFQRAMDRWLQTGLQRLVAPDLTVDGQAGQRTRAAIKTFQQRVHEFVPGVARLDADGVAGPATIAALETATGTRAPAVHTMAVSADVASAVPSAAPSGDHYAERRVRVRVYGTMAADSPLLVPVPAVSGGAKRLHRIAAAAMREMGRALEKDLGIELKLASGWRAHRWQSRAQYEAVLVQRFGSVAEGKRWLAFDSPHETGLAMDIGVGGLKPSRASVAFQREQPIHRWLIARAWEFGWHPYKTEPWHWEYPISLEAHRKGVIAPGDLGPPEDEVAFGSNDDEDVLEDMDLEEEPEPPARA